MTDRFYMLIIKLLGIKGFIWVVGTALLWFGKLNSSDWMLLSVGVGGLNVAQKVWVGLGRAPGNP
jgi:hypothetical protein